MRKYYEFGSEATGDLTDYFAIFRKRFSCNLIIVLFRGLFVKLTPLFVRKGAGIRSVALNTGIIGIPLASADCHSF